MKICLFSDIHGNNYAFEEFLKSSSRLGIDEYIFCGDIFGYYYDQNEVISKLRKMDNLYSVRGNHDQNFLDICAGQEESAFFNKYGSSYRDIAKVISAENRRFIENMPMFLEIILGGKRIGVFHGSPGNELNGRWYPDTEIPGIYLTYDFLFLGHTHYRMTRLVNHTTILNPGSIGQPRDKNGFSFATVTIPSGQVQFHQVVWDRNKLIMDIAKHRDNYRFAEVLFRNEV